MADLGAWTEAVCAELGLQGVVDPAQVTHTVLDLARDVAHGVDRPAAPLTTFLVGVAAGRATDPSAAFADLAARVAALAAGWEGEPS